MNNSVNPVIWFVVFFLPVLKFRDIHDSDIIANNSSCNTTL